LSHLVYTFHKIMHRLNFTRFEQMLHSAGDLM
jgi:hypothetical protein